MKAQRRGRERKKDGEKKGMKKECRRKSEGGEHCTYRTGRSGQRKREEWLK